MEDLRFEPSPFEYLLDAARIYEEKLNEVTAFDRGVRLPIMDWIEKNRLLRGEPFSFSSVASDMMLGDKDHPITVAPRPYQKKILEDPCKDLSIIKCRQCLTEDNYIFDGTRFWSIREVVEGGYRGPLLTAEEGGVIRDRVTVAWKGRMKECLQITTRGGYSIECSTDHKVMTPSGWVRAEDLRVGQEVRVCPRTGFGPLRVGTSLARMMGWFLSDFGFTGSSIYFTNTNKEYVEEVARLSAECFSDLEPLIKKREFGDRMRKVAWDVRLSRRSQYHSESPFLLFSRKMGLRVSGSDRVIPDSFMLLCERDTSEMLNRLFAGDGYATRARRLSTAGRLCWSYEVGLGSPSKKLLLQVQFLLSKYGIRSCIEEQNFGEGSARFWKLRVYGVGMCQLFAKKIGITGKTEGAWLHGLRGARTIGQDRREGEIKSIESVGSKQTYDLSVGSKRRHSFLANGVVVSNSENTEGEINSNLYLACTRPHTTIHHVFPSYTLVGQIAKQKISPAVMLSPKIHARIVKPYNLQSFTFDNGSFYLAVSSWALAGGRGASTDKITFDEYEFQNPAIEEIFAESTSHSMLGKRTRISTPMFPGGGIDAKFSDSCQYEWWTLCPKCHKTQRMSFPDSLIGYFPKTMDDTGDYYAKLKRIYIGCKFCGAYIDRTSKFYLNNSEWIAHKPSLVGLRSGYRITYFMLPWKTGMEVAYKSHQFKYLHQFHNEVLGNAFVSEDANISRATIEACSDPMLPNVCQKVGGARNISIGVDWGNVSWVVVMGDHIPSNPRCPTILYVERIDNQTLVRNGHAPLDTEHARRVMEIADTFGANILVNDANGIGNDRNILLRRRYMGKSWGAFYDSDASKRKKRVKTLDPVWNKEQGRVTVSRTGTLKMILGTFRDKDILFPRREPTVDQFIEHVHALAVEKQEDPESGAEYEVVGKTGPDHLAHSYNYARIGYDRLVGRSGGTTAIGSFG